MGKWWAGQITRYMAAGLTFGALCAAALAPAHATGPEGGGRAVLPSGRRVTPAGTQVAVGGFPQAVALSPGGGQLAVADVPQGPQQVSLVDTQAMTSQSVFPVDNKDVPPADQYATQTVFDGLAWSPDGQTLWVSGGNQSRIMAFDVAPGRLVQDPTRTITIPGNADVGPIALSGDGAHLYVVDTNPASERVLELDPRSGAALHQQALVGDRPFAIAVTATRVYVGGMLSGDVVALDPSLSVVARQHAGTRPMALAVANRDLLVADANGDELDVMDAADLSVRQRVPLSILPGGIGTSPNAIAVQGDRAVVTLGGINAVAVVERHGRRWSRQGALPTGWTPEAVALSPDGATAYVANARGEDSETQFATTQHYGPLPISGWAGTVSRIPILSDLSAATAKVIADNTLVQPADSTLLSPQGSIRHVVFILRENKSFDCDLGDTPGGDPRFVLFPRPNTPNLHALAARFASLTNVYADAEYSDEGHEWAAGGYVTDYVERFAPSHGSHTSIWGSGNEPIEYPTMGYIFDAAQRAGISWRDYGEFLPRVSPSGQYRPDLAPHRSTTYPGWDQSIPDTRRVQIWQQDFTTEPDMPAFTFLWLPNDHGLSVDDTTNPTFQQQVADNDLATGQVVDTISHSKYWSSTAIFLTEDDPQGCLDHVEAHRTIGLIISPWATSGTVDTHTDTAGLVKTMEMILGLRPTSSADATARPVAEAFTSSPNSTPFVAAPVGFGPTPSPAALALTRSLAPHGSRDGPDQVDPHTEIEYGYLSVYGETVEDYLASLRSNEHGTLVAPRSAESTLGG